ncbi:MAG: short-chain fatty acyl-CoA regulator family protein [Hyphomicrobiaceae bacterium]
MHVTRTPIGNRLRAARRRKRLTQTRLAELAGISVSYLNLIEHDKRPIGGALLGRLARHLEIDLDQLVGVEDARLVQQLMDLAGEPLFRDLPLAEKGAQTIVTREPEWARAVVRLHNAWHSAGELVEAVTDQLNRDPYVAETSHEILSLITSIRSFSEILAEHSDLPQAQRSRFVSLMAKESAKLAGSATTLFSFMSDREVESRPSTPAGEVDDFMFDNENYFPRLEEAADALRARIAKSSTRLGEDALIAHLRKRHSLKVAFGDVAPDPLEHPVSRRRQTIDNKRATLTLDATLTGPSAAFQLALAAFRLEHSDLLQETANLGTLTTDDARNRAVQALARYGAAAVLMPYDRIFAAAEAMHYDVQLIASQLGATFEQVCHRLTSLKRRDAQAIPLAFMRTDPAGNISKRLNLPDLRLPRHGGACPLWAIYRAFQMPGQICRQLIELPDGRRFVLVARTVTRTAVAFGAPQPMHSVMLAFNAEFAHRTVYGESLLRSSGDRPTPAGITCRLCPRPDCSQRAFARIAPQQRRNEDREQLALDTSGNTIL